MASWSEAGSAGTPAANLAWSYDAVGNVRRSQGTYRYLNLDGTTSPYPAYRDAWYAYDAMDRVTVSDGALANGQVVGATAIAYDAAGERRQVTATVRRQATVANPNYDPEQLPKNGNTQTITVPYQAQTREEYAYNGDGTLATVRIAEGSYTDGGGGSATPTTPGAATQLKASFSYDLLGRQTRQQDWTGDGTGVAYDRLVTYDAAGRVTAETDVQRQGSDTFTSTVANQFGTPGTLSYALGAVTSSTTATAKNNGSATTSSTTTTYAWYDGAVQSLVGYKPDQSQSATTTTTYTNSGTGVLQSASIQDGRPRTVTLLNDALGQAIRRDEADNNTNPSTGGDPHELWYRFDGRQIGHVGDNGTLNTGYATSIQARTAAQPATPAAFRNGTNYGDQVAEFDQSYDAINSWSQGASGGSYTVRQGDTLSSIAAQLWGDASLWYKLAQANGLSANSSLTEGTTLTIPSGVNRSGNSASTFRPYDASDAYGDTSPTTPKPRKGNNNCGVFGAILRLVITLAVAAIVPTIPIPVIGPAISAAAVSTVSQGISTAVGLQDHIDWKAVGTAALTAAVTSGLDKVGAFKALGVAGNGFGAAAARGALSNAVSQGIGTAVGLQSRFDFAGVAAAGIGAGVRNWAGGQLGATSFELDRSFDNVVANTLANTASGIANAATRSLIDGTDFGDNIVRALPDVIGNTLGSLAAEEISSGHLLRDIGRGIEDLIHGIEHIGNEIFGTHRTNAVELTTAAKAPDDIVVVAAPKSFVDPSGITRLELLAPPLKERASDAFVARQRSNLDAAGVAHDVYDGVDYVYMREVIDDGHVLFAAVTKDHIYEKGIVAVPQDYSRLSLAENRNRKLADANYELDMVQKKGLPVILTPNKSGDRFDNSSGVYGRPTAVYWNPYVSIRQGGGYMSAATALIHEIGHAFEFFFHKADYFNRLADKTSFHPRYGNAEEHFEIRGIELKAARFFGEPARSTHEAKLGDDTKSRSPIKYVKW